MTTREAALAHLEQCLSDCRDPDPDQRRWKQISLRSGIDAYERVAVLAADEASRWRERVAADPAPPDPAPSPAAEDHLGALVARVPPMRRTPDPAGIAAGMEASLALSALQATGVLDDAAATAWQARLLSAQAPWLEDPQPAPPGALQAVHVPPETPEQEAEDEALRERFAAHPAAREVRRVVVGSPERHDDLALVAVVVHEDAVALHFHALGDPVATDGRASMRAFRALMNGLPRPALTDDQGTAYEPLEGVSATGAGGPPDPERRQALTGAWLYTPTAPDTAQEFFAQAGDSRWVLRRA